MVGIGMIGAGIIGQVSHLANYSEIADCRLVAIAELRPRLGTLAAEKFGIPKVYPSHRELIADPEVDAVIVATRRPATGPVVLDALRAGKHVLSEKPMAHTANQARLLVDAAAERGLTYAVGFMKRHDEGVGVAKRLLAELIRSGELGRITFVRAYCFSGDILTGSGGYVMTDETRSEGLEVWPTVPDWLPREQVAQYEEFLNVYVHIVNLLRFVVGETPSVSFANLAHRRGQIIALEFGEFAAILELGNLETHGDWNEGIEIFFERGKLTLRLPQPLLRGATATVQVYHSDESRGATNYTTQPSWAFRRQAEAFVQDVMRRQEPVASGRDSLRDIELIEAIHSSTLERRAP